MSDLDAFLNETIQMTSDYSKLLIERLQTNVASHSDFISMGLNDYRQINQKIEEHRQNERDMQGMKEQSKKFELALMKTIEDMDSKIEEIATNNQSLSAEIEKIKLEIERKESILLVLKKVTDDNLPNGVEPFTNSILSHFANSKEEADLKSYQASYNILKQLRQRHQQYMKSLCLRLDNSDKTKLKLIFTKVNKKNENEEYWVEFSLLTDAFNVVAISHQIPWLNVYLSEANVTNNFSLLVQRIRQSFYKIANNISENAPDQKK